MKTPTPRSAWRSSLLLLALTLTAPSCGIERIELDPLDNQETASPTERTDTSEPATETTPAEATPRCGNGILDDGEACDDGDANSDTVPNACRTSCRLAYCGDGVIDAGESCDDSNSWGGDGCSPVCIYEDHPSEQEANDSPWEAQSTGETATVMGSIDHEGDVDCYAIPVPEAGWFSATIQGGVEPCSESVTARIYGLDNTKTGDAYPRSEDGCTAVGPAEQSATRYLNEGTYTLCVEGFLQSTVSTYTLVITVGQDSCSELDVNVLADEDLDLDGTADVCDDDDDGDGVVDTLDNCPTIANGGETFDFATHTNGFIRHWLVSGAHTGTVSAMQCLPSSESLVATDDSMVEPSIGDEAGPTHWAAHVGDTDKLDFLAHFVAGTPREAYAATYIYAEQTQSVILSLGADDGMRVWLNGTMLGEVSTCQAVVNDQFSYDTTLVQGWNRLVVKIRDQGGGWGLSARFLDTQGEPLAGQLLSLMPGGPYTDYQRDADGDGIGDLCDDAPGTPDS